MKNLLFPDLDVDRDDSFVRRRSAREEIQRESAIAGMLDAVYRENLKKLTFSFQLKYSSSFVIFF